jgi:hypothetical protein
MIIWTFVLSTFGIVGNIWVGYRKEWIWRFAHSQNLASALYFIFTKQYGFIIENLFYAVIFINNKKQWDKQKKPPSS